ncbi:MAG: phenylalanine--tRNA ligase subunit beta, partial [OM182 bacterium]
GGVMGGLTTSVTSSTKNILLESAWFAPSAIAGRARSYGLSSDAAHRFERGVDWQGQISAMERATELLIAIVGGEAGPLNDCAQTQYLPEMEEVKLRASRVEKLLGVAIDASTIEGILERLGFGFRCSEAGNNTYWIVKAPSHRFDISIEADLIEEISRVYGYNSLPVRTPITSLKMRSNDESEIPLGRIRSQLVARGYQETINYSFVDPEIETLLDPEKDPLKLANPLSLDMSVMRTTLWTGLLKSLIYNLNRQHDRVRLFEVGLRFEQAKGISEIGFTNILQEKTVGGVACGSRRAENWANDRNMIDFYDVKGDLESILALTSAKFELMPVSHPGLQAGQAAEIRRDEELVGYLGLLDPRVQKALVIRSPVYLFELKVEAITNKVVPKVELLSKFPEVRRDVAIIVDQSVTAENLITCIYSVNDESLVNLKLFDVYQGKGIDTNRKSIAMGLTFRHGSRTLNDEEINQSISKIVSSLKSKLGASLRD